jgi:hypothetical protein
LVEKYNSVLKDTNKVAFIHVSLDRSEELAEQWAAKEGFPWLHILPDDVDKSGLKPFHTTGAVPCYVMLDADGEVVVKGSAGSNACFQKAAELIEKDKA